jgi:hypothetical protein
MRVKWLSCDVLLTEPITEDEFIYVGRELNELVPSIISFLLLQTAPEPLRCNHVIHRYAPSSNSRLLGGSQDLYRVAQLHVETVLQLS